MDSISKDLQSDYDLLDLNDLLKALKKYFEKNNVNVDLNEIAKISKEQVLASFRKYARLK